MAPSASWDDTQDSAVLDSKDGLRGAAVIS